MTEKMNKKDLQRVTEVLFKETRGTRCDFVTLSEDTGIPASTLRRYRNYPELIPLERLFVIAKAMGLTPAEAGYLVTGIRTGVSGKAR
jgi:hypothetical protein